MGRREKQKRKRSALSIGYSKHDPTSNPNSLTPQQQLFAKAVQSFSVRGEHFSGPLPPPDVLRRYDEIFPGLGERIVAMAENQSRHRQGLEKTVVEGRAANERRGQTYGFILAPLIGLGSIGIIAIGRSTEGLSIILGELAALVGVFIYGRKRQERELAEKRQALMPSE